MAMGLILALKKICKRQNSSPPPLSLQAVGSVNRSLLLEAVPQYAYSCRKHRTRNVRNQSRMAGTGSSLAAWQRLEETSPPWGLSAQVVYWPATHPVHFNFPKKLGVQSSHGNWFQCPGRRLAWRLERRMFLNLSSECPHILYLEVLWAAGSSLFGSCQGPPFPGLLRAPSPHQTR